MATDNLGRLSRRLRAALKDKQVEAVVGHDASDAVGEKLESPNREDLLEVMRSIREVIPTDFAFTVTFEFDGIHISIEFEDGNVGSAAGGVFFTSRKSMLRSLRGTDWDELRTELMQQASIFDEMLNEADDRPANIPSSEAAALLSAAEIKIYVTEVRKMRPLPAFTLIIGRHDIGIGVEHFSDRAAAIFTIADLMTTGCDILGVLESGVHWPFPEIEAAKLEALEQLGPISRAKAERRYFV